MRVKFTKRSFVLRFAILTVLAWRISCVGSLAADDSKAYFAALKDFLDTDYEEYEVVFSVIYHSNEVSKRAQEMLSERLGNKSGSDSASGFDRPLFLRVRHAGDGWLIHRANTFAEIQQRDTSHLRSLVEGVVSNTFWSVHSSLLEFDHTKIEEMSKRVGKDWSATRAYAAAHNALSLGILARKGSLTWTGTNFTAEAAGVAQVPVHLRGNRCVSGYVAFSNGLPSTIAYDLGSNHFKVSLAYKDASPTGLKIPNQVGFFQEIPKNGWIHFLTVELIALNSAKFPPNSTGPAEFAQANGKMTVLNKVGTGQTLITEVKGRLVKPVPVRTDETNSKSLQKKRALVRWLIVATFLLFPLIFFGRKLLRRVSEGATKESE